MGYGPRCWKRWGGQNGFLFPERASIFRKSPNISGKTQNTMQHMSHALGSMQTHRAIAPRTVFTAVDLHAGLVQFEDPKKVSRSLVRAGFGGRYGDEEEVRVGEIGFGLSFCDPVPAGSLGDGGDKVPDFAERFNDQANFELRVPGLAGGTLGYLSRMDPELAAVPVCGLAVVETLQCAPGFSRWDVLNAGLAYLSMFTLNSTAGILFLHSEMDLHGSETGLWTAMSGMNGFRKDYPDWRVTTFPKIGPMTATMAGIIPPGREWDMHEDWMKIRCKHPVTETEDRDEDAFYDEENTQ